MSTTVTPTRQDPEEGTVGRVVRIRVPEAPEPAEPSVLDQARDFLLRHLFRFVLWFWTCLLGWLAWHLWRLVMEGR